MLIECWDRAKCLRDPRVSWELFFKRATSRRYEVWGKGEQVAQQPSEHGRFEESEQQIQHRRTVCQAAAPQPRAQSAATKALGRSTTSDVKMKQDEKRDPLNVDGRSWRTADRR